MEQRVEKTLGIVGSVTSIILSFIGLAVFLVYQAIIKTPEFATGYLQGGGTEEEIDSVIAIFSSVLNFLVFATIVFIILGIVALILTCLVKNTNKEKVGIYLIVLSVLHIFGLRIVSFILLLLGGLKLVKKVPNDNLDEVVVTY